MADIVIIDKVEDDDYQGKAFKKVTDKTGKTFNVKYGREGKLKAKWDLLIPGTAIEITWGTYNNIPFVQDFKVVAAAGAVAKLEPGKPEPTPLAEEEEDTTPPPAPQAVGMWWKVVADLIIAGKLTEILGKENAIKALEEFRGTLVSTLRIPFDGSKFPKYQ